MAKKPFNAEDENAIAEAAKLQEDRDQDLIKIMETPRGRRWIHSLIHTTCHVDLLSHVPGDTHTTAFNEGGRAIGLAIQAEARTSPNYLQMLEENDD